MADIRFTFVSKEENPYTFNSPYMAFWKMQRIYLVLQNFCLQHFWYQNTVNLYSLLVHICYLFKSQNKQKIVLLRAWNTNTGKSVM